MKKIEDKVNVQFNDVRINYALSLCCLCKNSEKIMGFLFDNISNEVIAVINSKQAVKNIPGKNGCTFSVCMDFNKDSSFSLTFLDVSLFKGDVEHKYSFNLSYFHNKMYYNDNICVYTEEKKLYDNDGNLLTTVFGNPFSTMFSISTHKHLSGFIGMYTTEYYSKKNKVHVKKINVEKVLGDIRVDLEDRKFYQLLDKETMKVFYPKFYGAFKLYDNELLNSYRNTVYLLDDLWYDYNHNLIEKDKFCMLSNIYNRTIEELYNNLLKNKPSNKLPSENIEFLEYDEWVLNKNKNPEIVVNMDDIPVTEFINTDLNNKFKVYNPNKLRYEDEEDEVINKNIKR